MSGSLSDYQPQRDTDGMAIATEKFEESALQAVAEQENHDDSVGDKSEDASNKVGVALKNKRKKKKAKRTAHEEDDIDKILAELGEAPPLLNTTSARQQEEHSPTQAERDFLANATVEKEVGEGVVEYIATKKKKNRKEKGKEKKAGSVEAALTVEEKQEPKSRAEDKKKVPRTVRELQEKIAKDKEEEERKKREEDERLGRKKKRD